MPTSTDNHPRRRLEENSLPAGNFFCHGNLRETSARLRSLSRHLEDERAEPLYLDPHRVAGIGIFGLDEASEKYECALLRPRPRAARELASQASASKG